MQCPSSAIGVVRAQSVLGGAKSAAGEHAFSDETGLTCHPFGRCGTTETTQRLAL